MLFFYAALIFITNYAPKMYQLCSKKYYGCGIVVTSMKFQSVLKEFSSKENAPSASSVDGCTKSTFLHAPDHLGSSFSCACHHTVRVGYRGGGAMGAEAPSLQINDIHIH